MERKKNFGWREKSLFRFPFKTLLRTNFFRSKNKHYSVLKKILHDPLLLSSHVRGCKTDFDYHVRAKTLYMTNLHVQDPQK